MKSIPALAALVMVTALARETPASADAFPLDGRPYEPFAALNLDGGMARDFDRDRFRWLGAAAAGLGLYDGSRVWNVTVGLREIVRDHLETTLTVSRQGVQRGIGFSAEGIYRLAPAATGAGVGFSFSLLNVEAAMLFDDQRATYLSLFLRVPIGLIVRAALKR